MTAQFSTCGTYRYTLTRKLRNFNCKYYPAVFIMLNPSTADATNNDPTIRRCISFAEREGCTDLIVVNLFALRATDPKELLSHEDPIGPLNNNWISKSIQENWKDGLIIAAWGSHPFAKSRSEEIKKAFGPLLCLGKTKNGNPRHPLYVKGDTPLSEL